MRPHTRCVPSLASERSARVEHLPPFRPHHPMDSASSRLHYAETYLKRSSDSSRTLQLYVNGALRVLEAERLGVQDAAALAAAAEWEAAGAALEAALRQLQRLLQGISADDGLRPSLERDWACKRRIVEAVTDLCRGPDARAAL
eukprot:ctg_2019.g314